MTSIGTRDVLPNEPPGVLVNQSSLRCRQCDQQVVSTWREGETPSKTAEKAMGAWREEHGSHDGYAEALPILGKRVEENEAPPIGATLYDRYPLSAPPPPAYGDRPPAPGERREQGGGGASPMSHYPGF